MNQLPDSFTIIILAAGKGTRMKSDTAKVLHTISGRPMIMYVVETAVKLTGSNVIVVVGTQADEVKKIVSTKVDVKFALQKKQKGTGHAVKCALPVLPSYCSDVIILCGDVPLIKSSTIQSLVDEHVTCRNDVTLLAVKMDNQYGYGRVVIKKAGDLERIVEESDASDKEKLINIINSGIYCVKRNFLESALGQLQTNNAQKEIYLTDIIGIACKSNKNRGLIISQDQNEIIGVNTPQDLQRVQTILG